MIVCNFCAQEGAGPVEACRYIYTYLILRYGEPIPSREFINIDLCNQHATEFHARLADLFESAWHPDDARSVAVRDPQTQQDHRVPKSARSRAQKGKR